MLVAVNESDNVEETTHVDSELVVTSGVARREVRETISATDWFKPFRLAWTRQTAPRLRRTVASSRPRDQNSIHYSTDVVIREKNAKNELANFQRTKCYKASKQAAH